LGLPPQGRESVLTHGPDVEDPNSLARLAEKADAAASAANNEMERRSRWLEAFKYYTAATERARLEDWPDENWRSWRYRRASLARLLAQDNMMEAVARTYSE